MSHTLRELFLARGATRETITHLRPVAAHEVLLVEGGTVDVFLCHLEAGGQVGRRVFLRQAGPHASVVVGMSTGQGFSLMAVTLGTIDVLVLPNSEMPGMLKENPQAFAEPLEDWLRTLTPTAIKAPLPILARAMAPGETVESKSVDRYYPRQTVLVQVVAGSVKFVDKRLIEASETHLTPLLPTTWLATEKGTVLRVFSVTEGLAREGTWDSLCLYGQGILEMVVAERERFTEIERIRIDGRAEVDFDTQKRGWKQMARVLTRERLGVVHQMSAVEPLLACCQQIGKNMGNPVSPPSRTSANDPLDDIARASNLRVRRVNLGHNWWKMDGGALIGWLKEDGRPVALLVPRPGVYMLSDPADGSSVRVNAQVAERLKPRAAMFYRRLPDRVIGLKELFSLALIGSRRDLIAMLVLGAATGTLALATPIATKLLFDDILPLGEISYLHQLMWGLLLVALCNIMFMFSYSVAMIRFGGRFGSDLATSMFDRLLTLPMPFYRKYAIGDLAQRALGVTRIRDLVTGGTLTKIISSIFGLMSFILLLVYDLKLALIAGGLLAINLVFSTQTGLQQLRLRRRAADLSGQVNGILYQILGGLPKLRVAGAESRFFAYWSARFAHQMDFEYRAGNLAAVVSVFNTTFPVLSTFLLFSYVGVTMDPIPTGTLLGFLAAFAQCTAAIAALSNSATEVSAALPQLERTAPILAAVPEKDEQKIDPGELSGAIELANVCFRYRPDQAKILHRVSIKVEPREFVALVGGTGAGKSTVLNLLLGFDQPESGSVFFDKKDLSMLDVQGVRQQIGVVLQNGRIVKDTVYRNVASGRPISEEQTWEALRMVGLDVDVEAMPTGLDTVISPETFSGGQAQRLLIARAIVSRPRIIFFDEATSALDNQTQSIVSSSLENLNAARVVIAHRLSTIRAADRIYVMSEGEVVQVGNFEELSAVPGLFAELMARQHDGR